MRRSQYFLQTLREDPTVSDVAGHILLLRGGYVAPLASGIYSFLPLGERVKRKVEAILRQEMEELGALEVSLPIVQPADLWKESGRLDTVGEELTAFEDRSGRPMVLAMTHEEVVADLVRRGIRSYRQLPIALFQIQTKFRDEPRARGGLIRAREFVMKDAYSCHTSEADLGVFYSRMHEAYLRIFAAAGLAVVSVGGDVGMMGGTAAHEFMYLSTIGEDQLVQCQRCGYAANRQVATSGDDATVSEEPAPLEEVATPGAATIAQLSSFLSIPASRTAKAAFFMAGSRLIFAVVRGDKDVNETKLARVVNVSELRAAQLSDLAGTGIVPGYASPIGIQGAMVVVDVGVRDTANLVAGANREGFHFLNTNYGRDYMADVVDDIVAVAAGDPCVHCGAPVELVKGVEVGNIFKLGTKYAEAFGSTYLDGNGRAQSVVMGSYGIGVGRLIACVAEEWRDEKGLRWPTALAPFHVYLVGLDTSIDIVRQACEHVYQTLVNAGVEVLFDDRAERAGVKFNDADLLGFPLRVTVSRRTVEARTAEVTPRSTGDRIDIALDSVAEYVKEFLSRSVPSLTTPQRPPTPETAASRLRPINE